MMTDRQLEVFLGKVLRWGVIASAFFCILGGAIYLVRHGGEKPMDHVFHGEPKYYRTLHGMFEQADTGHGRGIILIGLILLIATPVLRVALSMAGFVLERDRLYTAVTLLVLAILCYSLFWGG
jgi:uncharacterized membrane protein